MFEKSNIGEILADPRHKMVADREKGADGQFVFAVRTTGVFCKPSCGARQPRPENIRFFDTCEQAHEAGYRPCLRCWPTLNLPHDTTTELMRSMAEFIGNRVDEPLSLVMLADQAGMSSFHFQRTFKRVIGLSPRRYQDGLRMGQFKQSLKKGTPVLNAALDAGFSSINRVYAQAAVGLGMTPASYRAGGQGEIIAFATRESSFGKIMMAATARGVCFVQFGDSDVELLVALRREFPKAKVHPSDPEADVELDRWVDALNDHLSHNQPCPSLPLDMRGTAFQLKVWNFLLSVKPGSIISYSELAEGIGRPKAVRAAASACASNRIGVLIPCHRVLRAGGQLGGYRWGLLRKQSLLAIERAA